MIQVKIGLSKEVVKTFKRMAKERNMTTSRLIREILLNNLSALGLLDKNAQHKAVKGAEKPSWKKSVEQYN